MSAKRKNTNPATTCTCDKCGMTDNHAVPGKPHRKCGGDYNSKPKGAKDRLPGSEKGEWKLPE